MLLETTFYPFFELTGTIAFACSGAMIAIQNRLDYLGVVVLGVITAVGGGMFRDLLIGHTPPALFLDPTNTIIAFFIVSCLFVAIKTHINDYFHPFSKAYDDIINLLDAIGLGLFTATGINVAISAGYEGNTFLCIFLGVITGVGGGILRDILAGRTPSVLRKHIYACASIAGAACYLFCLPLMNSDLATLISSVVVVTIRVLARRYDWNLPVIETNTDKTGIEEAGAK